MIFVPDSSDMIVYVVSMIPVLVYSPKDQFPLRDVGRYPGLYSQ